MQSGYVVAFKAFSLSSAAFGGSSWVQRSWKHGSLRREGWHRTPPASPDAFMIIIMHRGPPIQGRSYIVQEQSVNKSNIWPSRGSLCIRRAAGQRLRGCTGPTKGCDGMFSLAQGCIKLSLFHQVTGCLSVDLILVGPCYEARVLARRVRLRKQQQQQRIQQFVELSRLCGELVSASRS